MKQAAGRKRNGRERSDRAGISSGVAPSSQVRNGWRTSFRLGVKRAVDLAARDLLSGRAWVLGVGHCVLFALVYWLAFLLRFDFAIPREKGGMDVFWPSLGWVLGLKLSIFYASGHYHGWWRYVTFADLAALLRASALSLVALAALDHFVLAYQIPRAVLILDCILGIVVLGSLRASWRLFREHFWLMLDPKDRQWALLVGADHSNGLLAHQLHSHPQVPYRVKGFLATNGEKRGSRLGQIPVLGHLENVREIATASGATDILVTAGTLPGNRLRRLMEVCKEAGLNLKIIPPLEDLFNGDHRVPVRDIEINDLLHRDPVELDTEAVAELLEGRRVMVTGAGGSIGSEICRQVLKFNPQSLVLVGRGENRIFAIEQELQTQCSSTLLHACIADVTNKDRMRQLVEKHRCEVIFHAAAHKHVPLMEANVGEAIRNNVLGTRCLADVAHEFGVENFVFISTDKAVNPSSVSKQIAERYVHSLSQESSTRFTVVRFGNVLGSAGSVVPIFQEQIRRGGPITITDPRMMRFFMTIPEASQLVLQAAAMGRGGEIFVLEMGEPVRIVDLARDLIHLSGLPEDAIEVVFSGVRPGEKLYEELYFDDEQTLPTSHAKVRAAYHRMYSLSEVHQEISDLERLVHGPEEAIRRKLHEIAPEYNPPSAHHGQVQAQIPQPLQLDEASLGGQTP